MRVSGESGGGRLRATAAFFLLLAFLCPFPAQAVVTFDLLHDTPKTRGFLKEELGMAFQPGQESGVEDPGKSVAAGELEVIWFAREKFLQIGEREKARTQIEILWKREMEMGIRNLPEYGEVLVREARREMQRGRYGDAREALTVARKISPEFLPLYFAQASLTMREAFWDVLGAGRELFKGSEAVRRSFRLQTWAATNAFFFLNAGLIIFFTAAIAIMMLCNARRAAHDLSESMPTRLSSRARTLFGWMALALPLLVGLPVWWWFIIAGLFLLPYVGRFPRFIIYAGLLFLASLPWQVQVASSLLSLHRRPLLERVVSVREDHWNTAEYASLREMAASGEPSALALSALGLAAKRLGNFEEAEQAYLRALEIVPDDPSLLNNLGNLALNGKNVDQAVEYYLKAVQSAPDLFAPHFNLSLAYRDKFLFPEGEKESRRAFEIDPDANAYYTSVSGDHFNRYTVDELPSVKALWALSFEKNKWQEATSDHLWRMTMLVVPRQIWLFALGAMVLVAFGAQSWRSSRGVAEACTRCTRPVCPRCAPARGGSLCSQCHSIFVRKEGIEAKVKVKKMAEIKKLQQFRTVRRLVLAVLLPGGGHLAAGRFGAGTIFLLPASFYLAHLFVLGEPYPSVWYLRLSTGWGLAAAGAALYALWWALSLWTALRIEE